MDLNSSAELLGIQSTVTVGFEDRQHSLNAIGVDFDERGKKERGVMDNGALSPLTGRMTY